MNDTPLVIVANKSRRELCNTCEYQDMIYAKGEIVSGLGMMPAPEDFFVCDRVPKQDRMTCRMKAALQNRSAVCPHTDKTRAAEWNLAALDSVGGCGAGPTEGVRQFVTRRTPQQTGDSTQAHRGKNNTFFVHDTELPK